MIARQYFFSGRVQGVGFRYTTYEIARQFDVDGYVRNLPDGRVELWIQGRTGQIDAVVDAIEQAMQRNLTRVDLVEAPVNKEVREFIIRY